MQPADAARDGGDPVAAQGELGYDLLRVLEHIEDKLLALAPLDNMDALLKGVLNGCLI